MLLSFVVAVLVIAQFAVPRRFSFAPLIFAACHVGNVPIVEIFGVGFSITKLLILAGLLRAAYEKTFLWSHRHPIDVLVAVWATWSVLSGFAHNPTDHNPIMVRASMVYEIAGGYLYARAFIRNRTQFRGAVWCLCAAILALSLLMLFERFTGQNLYAAVGAPYQEAWVREGRIRAAGPFGNAILAGTIGAVSVPLMAFLYRENKTLALWGTGACLLIVFCSASSGPIVTLAAGIAGLVLWRFRDRMRQIRWITIGCLLLLHLIMNAPVWYIVARIDLAGGSTSWHRAEVINQAVEHFGEWWLVGTDYTRHWMAYGIEWSGDHIDVTNYYVNMGIRGGILMMLTFVGILVKSFQLVGRRMRFVRSSLPSDEFLLWCLGSCLAAHAVTFLGISYFDQSYVHLCLILGTIAGLARPIPKRRIQFSGSPEPKDRFTPGAAETAFEAARPD